MSNHPIHVGLAGFGMAGKVFHAPLVRANPRLRLTHVLERHGNDAQAGYPGIAVVRDIDELLHSPVELVIIATPTATHFDLAAKSLKAGKHVVVDKPFTADSRQAQELIDLARRQQKLLSVFHNRRWDADFRTLTDLLQRQQLGRLVQYESHFDRYRPVLNPKGWREIPSLGSGTLFDLGSHLIDQALSLFGLPQAVYADIRSEREGCVTDDSFELILDYPRLKVTLKSSMLVREPGPRFLVHGTSGSYLKYGIDPQEEALKQGHTPATTANWGSEPEQDWGILHTDAGGSQFRGKVPSLPGCYPAYYDNICQAIREGAELAVKPEDGRNTIRLIELAVESNREKRRIAWTAA